MLRAIQKSEIDAVALSTLKHVGVGARPHFSDARTRRGIEDASNCYQL